MIIRESTADKVVAVLSQVLFEAKIVAGESIDPEMDVDLCAEACQVALDTLGITEIAEGI